MFSKKGAYRSGDIHKCDQVNLIVSGEASLTTVENGIQKRRTVVAGEVVTTPAGTPHLFYFPVDSIMTEYWVNGDGSLCKFEAWFYKPLRKIIDAEAYRSSKKNNNSMAP